MNGISTPMERQGFSEKMFLKKQDPTQTWPHEKHFKHKDKSGQKRREGRKRTPRQRCAQEVEVLGVGQNRLQDEASCRDKDGRFIKMKGAICLEDTTVLSAQTPDTSDGVRRPPQI